MGVLEGSPPHDGGPSQENAHDGAESAAGAAAESARAARQSHVSAASAPILGRMRITRVEPGLSRFGLCEPYTSPTTSVGHQRFLRARPTAGLVGYGARADLAHGRDGGVGARGDRRVADPSLRGSDALATRAS